MSLPKMDTEKLELMTQARIDEVLSQRYWSGHAVDLPIDWDAVEHEVEQAVTQLQARRAQESMRQLTEPFRAWGESVGQMTKTLMRMYHAFGEGYAEGVSE